MMERVDSVLEHEARTFARYLLGRELDRRPLSDELVERYVRALGALAEEPSRADRVLTLARRVPRMLPWLDAGSALFRREAPIRHRLLIMTAILEASPEFVDHFISEESRLGGVSKTLLVAGLKTALMAPVGGALLLLLGAQKRR
jgi:hypothetical protein